VGLFKLTPGGEALRTNVKLGRSSVDKIEIIEGLQPGDQVILSDMSAQDSYDRIRIAG
jgi:HlyD family secretion protein